MKAQITDFLTKLKTRLFSRFRRTNVPKEKLKITPFTVLVHVVAWVIATIWLIPFLGVFIASIRPYSEVQFGWWNLQPFHLDLTNFADAWSGQT